MKTKAFLTLQILGIIISSIVSCSKEESYTMPEYYLNPPIATPKLIDVPDTVQTSFFTPGSFLVGYVLNWGNEAGKLSILTTNDNIKLDDKKYLIYWDNSLGLNNYTVSIEAENSMGKAKADFILKTSFGGYFLKMRNNDPNTLEDMQKEGAFIFDPSGDLYDCLCDYSWWYKTPGNWQWVSETEIEGSYLSEKNTTDDTDIKRAFKATVSYDKDTGYPRFTGFWYEDNQVEPGSEKGAIVFYMDISAYEYFHPK